MMLKPYTRWCFFGGGRERGVPRGGGSANRGAGEGGGWRGGNIVSRRDKAYLSWRDGANVVVRQLLQNGRLPRIVQAEHEDASLREWYVVVRIPSPVVLTRRVWATVWPCGRKGPQAHWPHPPGSPLPPFASASLATRADPSCARAVCAVLVQVMLQGQRRRPDPPSGSLRRQSRRLFSDGGSWPRSSAVFLRVPANGRHTKIDGNVLEIFKKITTQVSLQGEEGLLVAIADARLLQARHRAAIQSPSSPSMIRDLAAAPILGGGGQPRYCRAWLGRVVRRGALEKEDGESRKRKR